ncbi:penicillin-binding protein 2 [Marinobacter sp. X15-166B]|uniref:penicillin-binding protein 2 n=1 Tax=Marinobacter sp. X15-166B TaxID=1897620 RepID=UPI00085C1C47|nr:penicillin-binding protein 2 [Marinobacter sp. X15-166B]OEY66730.1 penicillin-binding protein 2 [Marinobacter sp. X15-166B]
MPWGEIKDTAAERRMFQRRTLVMLGVAVLLLGVLIGRMYQLQVTEHDTYRTLSDKNRVQVQSVPPTRGLIYDRNGVLLAENRPVFSVTLVPERVAGMDATLEKLQQLLSISEEDLDRFRRRLREPRRPYQELPLRYDLTEGEIARLAVHRHELPGVEVAAELVRYYPHGELTAHALGYVGRINRQELQRIDPVNYAGSNYIGKTGIEAFYEEVLHGKVGYQHVETNARGRTLRVLERQNPVPGEDLQLHLDIRLQQLAHELLDGRRGAIVAIDPNTGGLLALASVPGFDANLFVTGIGVQAYRELRDSHDKPLFNRALGGQYPPASTVKPMMAIAALDSGVIGRHETIWDPGYFQLTKGGHRYRDWKRGGHGWVDLIKAVAESCDTYFYDVAVRMGVDVIHEYLDQFGFGRNDALDVRGARSGLLPSPDWKRGAHSQPWYPGDTVNMGIGQGFMLATPLQLATATAVIANDGVWRQPRLLKDVVGDTPLDEVLPKATRDNVILKNPDDWNFVTKSMIEVMHGRRGSARRASVGASYTMAGKSGTAQVFSLGQDEEYNAEEIEERLRDHALFVGFAPVVDPQIVVSVIIENGGGGSSAAAPVVRALFDAWLEGFADEETGAELAAAGSAGESSG